MEQYAIYTANFAMEIAMLLILCFLLISCNMQKNRFSTHRPLILLTVTNMLLSCQAVEWQIMRMAILGPVPHVMLWRQLTYTLDYILYYAVSVSYFHYIAVYICELCAERKIAKPHHMRQLLFLIGWGVVISAAYGVMIFNQRFYFLDAGGTEQFNVGIYGLMLLMSTVGMISSCVILIQHYKLLKGGGFWLLVGYVVLPFLLTRADLLHSRCISYLMMSFFVFVIYIELNLRRSAMLMEQEAQLVDMQTKIMLSQMQPHFLYNTFATISTLCYLDEAPQAKEVVDKFAAYFRENMASMGRDNFIPFEKELEHIKTYLWIEKVRFEEALTVEYRIGATDFWIPSLTLQPLVENAVKHGICQKRGAAPSSSKLVRANRNIPLLFGTTAQALTQPKSRTMEKLTSALRTSRSGFVSSMRDIWSLKVVRDRAPPHPSICQRRRKRP